MSRPREKTLGHVRYFTYYLIFPHDKDIWVDQIPFTHDLTFELKQTQWRHQPKILNALYKKGEAHWTDHNGVTHRVIIEDIQRPRRWGIQRPAR